MNELKLKINLNLLKFKDVGEGEYFIYLKDLINKINNKNKLIKINNFINKYINYINNNNYINIYYDGDYETFMRDLIDEYKEYIKLI